MASKLDVSPERNTSTVLHIVNDVEYGTDLRDYSEQRDPFLVEFTRPIDKENPKDWPTTKKWIVTGVLSATGFNRIIVSTIMAPALNNIAVEFHMNSIEAVMSMSVYLLATAFGPLMIGPLSEIYGRKGVLHATNIWFLIWNAVCGFSTCKELLLVARFLAGFGASAVYALSGGVLGDLWRLEQRGLSLGICTLIPVLGAAVGPIVGAAITEATTWRWIFWSTSILQVIMTVVSCLLFSETYGPVILQQQAKTLRKATGNDQYYTKVERVYGSRSTFWVLQKNLTRPIRLLLFHPIIQVQAFLSAFYYGILYLVLSTFSDLWTSRYKEPISISGLHYIATCIGEVLGAILGGRLMDFVFRKLKARENNKISPEFRVPIMLPGYLLVPVGLLMYGWAAQARDFWIIVDIGAAILTFGMTIAGQALQAYVIDSYPDHTSSASAAAQFLRSLTAFGFPLFAPTMYARIGYGWGNTLLSLMGILFGVPVPIALWFYGAKLRAKAQSSF